MSVNILGHAGVPGLEEDLERVEAALRTSVGSQDPFLGEVARHLIDAGGKRLRPVLVLAAAQACGAGAGPLGGSGAVGPLGSSGPLGGSGAVRGAGPLGGDVIQGAVSVELVHLGSLYHDDVMDEAESRRGVESVNARWGNLVAILAGDFLLARASEIAASLGTEVAALLAATIGRLCEGQVAELQHAYSTGRNESAYFQAIAGKTASLMATACRIGALVTGAPRADIEAMTAFGQAFGMAFQIRDDVLDLVGSDDDLGKPAGHDLVEGVYTLPVIKALASPDVGADLPGLLGGRMDGPDRDKALDLIRSTDALAASMAVARRYADDAGAALGGLTGGASSAEAVRALSELAHLLLDSVDVAPTA